MGEGTEHRRSWWRRRSFFNIRNGRLVMLTLFSLLAGTAAAVLTAYLGVR